MVANYSGGSSGGGCRLEAMLVQGYSNEAFYKLFDIAPGLESLDYDRSTGQLLRLSLLVTEAR
jgi:hypothetical protein